MCVCGGWCLIVSCLFCFILFCWGGGLLFWAFEFFVVIGARCSSVVRELAHGAMGRGIDPSWWTHRSISRSSQCSTTDVTKVVVCVILSMG